MRYKVVKDFTYKNRTKQNSQLYEFVKGLYHGDFILLALRQNFAKIMIYCLHSQTKCSWNTTRNISSEFLQEVQTVICFSMIFARYRQRT